jgi:hypothetical protein
VTACAYPFLLDTAARRRYDPGTRAYLSAGLPGAEWWVAGRAVDQADDAGHDPGGHGDDATAATLLPRLDPTPMGWKYRDRFLSVTSAIRTPLEPSLLRGAADSRTDGTFG